MYLNKKWWLPTLGKPNRWSNGVVHYFKKHPNAVENDKKDTFNPGIIYVIHVNVNLRIYASITVKTKLYANCPS